MRNTFQGVETRCENLGYSMSLQGDSVIIALPENCAFEAGGKMMNFSMKESTWSDLQDALDNVVETVAPESTDDAEDVATPEHEYEGFDDG